MVLCGVCGLNWVEEWFFCKCVEGEARTIAAVLCCCVVKEEGWLFRMGMTVLVWRLGVVGEDLNGLFF